MRLGFHTNCFVWSGMNDIEYIADFAVENGFDCIEVGPGIPLENKVFERVLEKTDIAALIYCRNFLDDHKEKAEAEQQELYRRMEFASSIGVRNMIFSTGITPSSLPKSGGCDPVASLEDVCTFLDKVLEKAEKLDLNMCIENCPMYRNIATSPFMWHKIFERVPSKRLGLCYDPSHFVWQFIEPYSVIEEFKDRMYHFHVKDTELFKEKLSKIGILHNIAKEKGFSDEQWWRPCIPGGGELNWHKIMNTLSRIQYKGVLSIELEDVLYECDVEKVKKGLIKARKYISDVGILL